MRTGPVPGSSTFLFVSVSESCIDPAKSLVARQRRDHRPQLGPALLPGQRDAQRAQVAADCLQLAYESACVDVAVRALEQLAEPLEGLGRRALRRRRWRENCLCVRAHFVEVPRAAQRWDDFERGARLCGELRILHRLDRLDCEPANARQVVVHVVLRQAELLEVATHGGAGDARVAERRDRRAGRPFRELLAVLAEDQPVMHELRRLRAERLEQPAVDRLVRAVVEAAHDVRDAEVDVVDDGGELVGRAAVLAQQRDPVETSTEAGPRLAMPVRTLALPHRAFVPLELEPLQVADDVVFAAGHVPARVGVVDAQQHPVAQVPVRNGAEGVPDVQRTGGARSEAHPFHLRPSLESEPVEAALLEWFAVHGRELPWRRTRDPYAILVSEVMLQQTQVERVVPRYEDWLARWPTVDALASASAADVIRAWQGLGYNRRGLNLHRAAQRIAREGWPADLTELPGVGAYTAAAVSNFALGHKVLPVDTNVQRIQERTGHDFSSAAAQALMDLGATVCLGRIPRCAICPLAEACPSRGRRYEALRKQSRFEGSFRQRRARTLRLVAAAERPLNELDGDAVEALARDGLVTIDAGVVALPAG